MAKKRREPDVVRELQENARWSAHTNETFRWWFRGRPRLRVPRDVGFLPVMLVLVLGLGILVGGLYLVMFVLAWLSD